NDTRRPTPALGNWKDPILKPWAAEQMRLSNEELLAGKVGYPFLAQSRCWPGGVPGQLLWTTEPLYFIQTPKEVRILWQRDQWARKDVNVCAESICSKNNTDYFEHNLVPKPQTERPDF